MDNYIGRDGKVSDITSKTTLVCFHDLLGFGEMVSLAGGSLDSAVGELCKKRISLLRKNIGNMQKEFPAGTKLFQMNDSAVAVFDVDHYVARMHLQKEGVKSNPPSLAVFERLCKFLIASSKLHMATEFEEESTRIGPAGRTIVVAGHRWPIEVDGNDSVIDVPELQANLAFSEAYLVDSQGSKIGISGMSMYVNDLFFSLLKLGAQNNLGLANELSSSIDISVEEFPESIVFPKGKIVKAKVFHRDVEYRPIHSHVVSRLGEVFEEK